MQPPAHDLHALLRRQLKRCGLEDASHAPDAEVWACLLERVSRSYAQADQDRYTLERSLQVSSDEMQALYDSLAEASARALSDARRFEAVVSALGDGLCVLDERGCVTFLNPAARTMLACDEQEIVGRPILDRLRFRQPMTRRQIVERLRAEGMVTCTEVALVGCRAEPLPVSVVLNPILDGERLVGAVLAFRDTTESAAARRALEEARRRAEAASRAKSEFLATMSHELRTPLNGLLGMVAMLREMDLGPAQRDYVETAHASGTALLAIIGSILDFSKIEAGGLELEEVPFELDQVLDEVVDLHADAALAAGLDFDCFVARDVPRRVRGDPGRVRQVIGNLVSNALKFTREGGVRVALRLERGGEQRSVVRVEVRDTGVGIPEDRQDRIFSAFAQADGSTTRQYGGTGLGLAICRRLCWAMGGDIGVVSAPGRGSTFWFTLELAHAEPDDARSLSGVGAVLVAGADTPDGSLAERLRALGAEVLEVADVPAARAALERVAAARRVLVLPLDAQDDPLLDELPRAGRRRVHTVLTSHGLLPVEALSRAPRCDSLLRLPPRSRALREMLGRVEREAGGRTGRSEHRDDAHNLPPSAGPATLSLLVVDDNPVNQKVARTMLERLGHQVTTAENGREALEVLRHEPVDMVFMDCQMPVMDGLEATRRLRAAEPPGTHLPVVAMTANAVRGDRETCLAAGMDDYLSKPVRPAELAAMLERWGVPAQLS